MEDSGIKNYSKLNIAETGTDFHSLERNMLGITDRFDTGNCLLYLFVHKACS